MRNAVFPISILGHSASAIRRAAAVIHNRMSVPGGLILLACLCLSAGAQTGEWTWVSGSSLSSSGKQPGIYGELGVPAAASAPGSRQNATGWTDKNGNLWLFGGEGYNPHGLPNYLNDLWKFDVSTAQWTWMGGSMPPPSSFDYLDGVPGVYGTLGTPAPGNIPGSRFGAVGWTDSKGNLWLFGGTGCDSAGNAGTLNDLWVFDPTKDEWAWMGGSNTFNNDLGNPGVYGKLGVAAPGNFPGSRVESVNWTDVEGNLWLFGGDGYDSAGMEGLLNDLWKFTPSTRLWEWVSGTSTFNGKSLTGVYGDLGRFAAGNTPGGREGATGFTDNNGNLWLFGGVGLGKTADVWTGYLNDLWEFSPSKNEWAWMSGNSSNGAGDLGPGPNPGYYGTLQTPAAGNVPGGRRDAVAFSDGKGNLWLFGGHGYDSVGTLGYLNDFWEFDPTTREWAWMSGSTTVPTACAWDDVMLAFGYCGPPGIYGTLQTPAFGNTPGSRSSAAAVTDSEGNFWLFGGVGYDAADTEGLLGDLWEFNPNSKNLPVAAQPSFYPEPGTYSSWQTVAISDATPGAKISYAINGNSQAQEYSGPIVVSSSETIEAMASADGYANSPVATANYVAAYSAAATPTFSVAPGTYETPQAVTISDETPGATIYYAIGQAPTTSSLIYSGPITVYSSQIVNAIAVAEGYQISGEANAVYTIWPSHSIGNWEWISGSSTLPSVSCGPGLGICGEIGVFGELGVPAAGNMPGGRLGAVSWAGADGRLWLFGGNGRDIDQTIGYQNDFWMFDPSAKEWAWMGGSQKCCQAGVYGTRGTPDAKNIPGGREFAASWTDHSGHFWLFGGFGYDANGAQSYMNDLWEFDPSEDEWTWVAGSKTGQSSAGSVTGNYGTLQIPAPGNTPGGRAETQTWTDANGHLWLFGGQGFNAVHLADLNDMWEFDPGTKEWTWNNGSKFVPDDSGAYPAVYGTLGVPALGNTPGALSFATTWTDSSGHLWLFGGGPNALWVFDPSISEWAWMGGGNGPGVTGTVGTWASDNWPDPLIGPSGWTDANGYLWLFGGVGLEAIGLVTDENELWEFNPATREWALMAGNTGIPVITACFVGLYGKLGVPAAGNTPGGREHAVSWTDNRGALWLFGGEGCDSAGDTGFMNDLWEYRPSDPIFAQVINFNQPTSVTYGVSPIALSAEASSGLPVTFSVVSGPGKVSGSTLTITGVGTVVVAANQTGNADFAPAPQVTQSILVNKAPQTINFAPFAGRVTYGVKPITLHATASSGLEVSFRVAAGPGTVSGSKLTVTGAGAVGVDALQAGNSDYEPAKQVAQQLDVDKATLTVTAKNLSMKQGAAVPTLTYSMTGFVNKETQKSATTGEPRLTTTATSKSKPGTYPITAKPGTLKAKNYSFAFAAGTLTVTP